jgi:hypothetical protein
MDTQNKTIDNQVQNASAASDTDTPAETNGATVLLELESTIKNHLSGIDTRKAELKKTREMIASVLTNDATFKDHEAKAKESAKLKNATKSQLLKLPANASLVTKMHELSAEIKEMSEALSDYLREYGRMSGSNEIEGDDGTVREIVYVAKLVRKSSRS